MSRLKVKILLMVIFLISTIFILTFNLSAQEREKERGYKGPICKERMRSIFSKGGIVEGYVIKGDDIIEIIEKTDFEIKIDYSIIEGGLNFRKLIVPLEKENLPEFWNEKEKDAFIESFDTVKNITIVKNKISFTYSEIRIDKLRIYSIYAFNTLFHESINFTGTTFSGKALFVNSTFNGTAKFNGAIYSGEATFMNATFRREADFHYTIFSGRALFWNTIFSGKALFWVATFSGKAFFRSTTFSSMAYFRDATFNGRADFLYSTFNGEADFLQATFSGEADFRQATFNGRADFSSATFNKSAYFKEVSFFGGLYVAYAVFKEYTDFRESKIKRFHYNCYQRPTILEGRIDFRNVIISEAHFQDIIFEKDVDFSDAKFGIPLTTARLDELQRGLEFSDSLKNKIHYEATAKLLIFTGYMTKSEKEELAKLSEDSQYRRAIEQLFRESTSATSAIVFRFVTFESDAYFLRAKFSGDTALERVTFKKEANFTDADFKGKKSIDKQRFSLSYLNFKNMLIKWSQLPNPKFWVIENEDRIKSFADIEEEEREIMKGEVEKDLGKELEPLSQVLKGLEANFRNQKQLPEANKVYYFKKKAEFKEERNSMAFWKWFPKQALWSLWWISCGYGTKILWILGWLIFFDLLFAMIYSVKNNLNKKTHPETKREFTFKQRLFDFPRLYLTESKPLDMIKSKFAIKFINALRFSSVILLKVGYRDTKISGKILGIDCKYIVWTEWLLGFYLLACLTVTMSNTIPIINSLISGIF